MPPGRTGSTAVGAGTQIVGTYEIEKLINKGGMGEVYRGRNIHNGEPVAIKIVLPGLAHDPKIVALFQKESTVLGRLSHEAIVRYHMFTSDPVIGRPCLVMEFVEGQPLSDRIAKGPMPLEDVRTLLRRVASGLEKAHRAGVVHRDLSPDNIILEGGEVAHAKIIDFGIAKATEIGGGTLLQGQFAGKFNYVSPEQLGAYDGVVDGRSDIYSLGLLIVGACRGKALSMGSSIVDAVGKRQSIPDLSDVYPELRPLLERMLQPDPALRPPSMGAVIEMMDDMPPPLDTAGADDLDPNRTVIAGSLPISHRPGTVPPSSMPPRSAPPQSTAGPQPIITGLPGSRPAAEAPAKKSGKGGLIAVLLVLLVAGGGAGAWFGGLIGPKPGPATPPAADQTASTETPKADTPGQAPPATQTPPAEPPKADTASQTPPATPPAEPPKPDTAGQTPPAEPPAATADSGSQANGNTGVQVAAVEPPSKVDPGPQLDLLGRELAWLRDYNLGPCVYTVLESANGSDIALEGYGTTVDPFTKLLDGFKAEFGTEPDIGVRLINETQCAVLDYMSKLGTGQGVPLDLKLLNDSDVLKSGATLSGRVEGVNGRSVTLFLVNGAGGATNLKQWVARSSDGSLDFNFSVSLAKGAPPAPQLILAIATDTYLPKFDVVPNGVAVASLMPFILTELKSSGQNATVALRYFRLEN